MCSEPDDHRSDDVSFSVHHMKGCMLVYFLPGDLNFGDLIKALSTESRHCKVTIFLFVMDKYLGEDTLRVSMLISCSSSNFPPLILASGMMFTVMFS